MESIYLDYNATTPIDPLVAEAMQPYLTGFFGNPSSIHAEGMKAKEAVETARSQVAKMVNCHPDEIIFTSGGTESNNFAIKGTALAGRNKGNHIITSCIEHPSVLEVCRYLETQGFTVTYLPVDEYGMVDPEDVEKSITSSTILVTIMHANNETGTIQPVDEIGRITREHHIPFHSDAAQSAGKIPVDVEAMNVDLLSLAGHKIYAPKGVGALYIRRGFHPEKQIHGADHEQNLRAGTENVLSVAGFGKACELVAESKAQRVEPVQKLRDLLFQQIRAELPEIKLNGHPERRLPNTLNISFPGVEAALLLERMAPVEASAGAACHSDSEVISPVLTAMKVPVHFAMGSVRFSLGRMTKQNEIEEAIPIIINAYKKLSNPSSIFDPTSSSIQHPASSIQHPASSIQHRASSIEHPASSIEHPASEIKLTHFTHGLGCACKIRPQYLEKILKELPVSSDPNVLVGLKDPDDAAVYRIDEQTTLVQTVDFFTPVVDDPYDFGAVAAANALSDIYAMGGKPLFALSIVGFPDKLLPPEVLQQILKGASDKAAEAGISIIGGHTIEDTEPKFGLVVTGIVDAGKILSNSSAKPGDVIILTKPLGTGILSTGIKRGLVDRETESRMISMMARLNDKAAAVMAGFPVSACTDVTGFGLLGHLKEMILGSKTGAEIDYKKVPVLSTVWALAAMNMIPGGTRNNLQYVEEITDWDEGVPELAKVILADAQTSGGLLIALPPKYSDEFVEECRKAGISEAVVIGNIKKGKRIRVK
ncbi:MAG: selenide, water dikinase SelD [Bacteroidetes bacterium]|nr:selenide, water dikinase SelD [Bacteroidota bacterium]